MKLPVIKTPLQIRYFDIDTMGHVSNSAYLQYCDLGRIDFFRAVRAQMDVDKIPLTTVAEINMEFLQEVCLKDDVYLETWCNRMGTKSMEVTQYIYTNGELATKVVLILVGWDKKHKATMAFPEEWEPSIYPPSIDD